MPGAPFESAGQLLTFRIANDRFAVPASAVREVVRPPRATRVPYAPESLVGLANLRGKVVPVVALGKLIDGARPIDLGGLVDPDGARTGRLIVLERADPVGLLVDEVSAVVADGSPDSAALIDLEPLLAKAFKTASAPTRAARAGAVTAIASAAVRADEVALLAFALGGQDYALPIGQIEEVMRLPRDIAPLPMSDAAALGAVARRGGVLPLLSLRSLLGLDPTGTADAPRVLIVRVGAHIVGLVVDTVSAILRVAESEIDPVPAVLLRGRSEARIQAICRTDGGSKLVSILATDHLLRADLTSQLQQHAITEGEVMEGGAMQGGAIQGVASRAATEQFLIFRVGGQEFGMPIGAVREVTAPPDKLTRVPRAPVGGVMNLRGKAIPVIDQGRCFDGSAAAGDHCRVIVIALEHSEAGVLVDAVAEVLRVPIAALGAAPELAGERSRLFDRVVNLDAEGRMILIVDPRELLDRAERDLLAAVAARESVPAS